MTLMINTTTAFEEYIGNLQFSCVYAETSFPLKLLSSLRLTASEAADYLQASAVAGNRSAGFFRTLPLIRPKVPIRGVCVFFTLELPDTFSIPVFICRDGTTLLELLPLALKTSQDANIPVQVVLGANALYNYTDKNFKLPDLARLTPYIQSDTFAGVWEVEAKNKKLLNEFTALSSVSPMQPFEETMVFEDPFTAFPKYAFPINIKEQRDLFKGLKIIKTAKGNAPFFHYLLNDLLNLNIQIEAELGGETVETAVFLCPGCPFALFSSYLSLNDYLVFTSISCAAVEKKFGFSKIRLQEFLGLNFKKLNHPTLYIGNLSETSCDFPLPAEDWFHFIFLKDTDARHPFPSAGAPYKLKHKRDFIFPYSCESIKRYGKVKINRKKCKCGTGAEALCASKTACPALAFGETHILLDETLCTGCRACVPYCKNKALS
jgi:NAD-dependent dihydropyrimidine dehydrogenase PreA subunit